MADLNTQTFDQIVTTQATVVQGESSQLVDYSTGSILRSVAESVAAVALWLQALILVLLTTVRASTSTGSDLDSWMADFGVTREAATAASGSETFGRYTATAQATISPGAIVQTGDGSVQYQVIADTTQAVWSSSLGAYVIPAGTATITATIQCTTAGTVGNVAAATIDTLGQGISGVDYCTNAAALTNGTASESDTALRARFPAFLASLAKATKAAIGYAITALGQNYTYLITEFEDPSGNARVGYFFVTLNDGTGSPSSSEIASVTAAVDAVRACGIQFTVVAPTTLVINGSVAITVASGYTLSTVETNVQTAVEAYISGISSGGTLSYSYLYTIIWGVAGVASASGLLVNGGTADITASAREVMTPGTWTVS